MQGSIFCLAVLCVPQASCSACANQQLVQNVSTGLGSACLALRHREEDPADPLGISWPGTNPAAMHGNALKAILRSCPLVQDGEDRWYSTQTCLGFSRSDQMWQQPLGNARKWLLGQQGSPKGVGWAWHHAWRGTRIESCSLLSYLSLNQFNSILHARIAHIPGVNLVLFPF